MKYYLYNNLANNGIKTEIEGVQLIDASKIDYQDFFNKLNKEDEVVIVGGDGTINYFINHVDTDNLKNNVYIYGGGSGNDFLNDIEEDPGKEVLINEYLKNLPIATVKGKKIKYVNNVGVGLDGYICVVAERIKEKSPKKKINYTTIAISSLLFHFKPVSVEIEVDGNKYHYDNVWLAPTMKGRFYGGGMMIAPGQRRNEDFLSVIVYSCKSKIKSLMLFPKVFTGEHVKRSDVVKVITGKKIHVKFSSPCACQIDGEVIEGVSEYSVEL